MMKFDYRLDFDAINFRQRPELYRIGRGEQGVLSVEPYKSEILPHWRFKTAAAARRSAAKIYRLYLRYKAAGEFVGMDMARKFLQMGWTRSLRYAKHKSGRKYVGPVPAAYKGRSGAWGRALAPDESDEEKLKAAIIFKQKFDVVRTDPDYTAARRAHRERYEGQRAGQQGPALKRSRKTKRQA